MLSQLINTSERTTIPLERIKTDGGTQMRATLDPDTVQEYLDAMQPVGWGDFPAVVVYYDGKDHWLADGFHRVEAYRLAAANLDQPANVPADVRSGTRRDAILHAAGANASHGLRRTNADKRRAVETLLRDDDWRHWSNREIARRCAVGNTFVDNVRRELSAHGGQIETERTVIRNGTTYTQNTANIGATRTLASETPARPVYSALHTPPVPGWDDDDEAEYQAQLPIWQKPALEIPLTMSDRITRRRVAERLSLERMDNLRHTLQERRRELWLEERRQERSVPPVVDAVASAAMQTIYDAIPDGDDDEEYGADAAAATVQVIEFDADEPTTEFIPVSQRDDYDSDEWYTPAEYIEAARRTMGSIDLDPATCEMAQTIVQADVYLTKMDNGLGAKWLRENVWLNPPYSNSQTWIDKLLREVDGVFVRQAIVLVNNATETAWFQSLLARSAVVCFPGRRLQFWRHDHSNVGARQGQAIFYIGPNDAAFIAEFEQFGTLMRRVS